MNQNVVGSIGLSTEAGAESFSDAVARHGNLPAFVHVEHEKLAAGRLNLMHASRVEGGKDARAVLNALTNSGYYIYKAQDGESRLVHHTRVRTLWRAVVENEFQMTESGVVYTYTPPVHDPVKRLVVVFSAMAANPFDTSINRYFQQPYASLKKFLPPDTGVLRVADVGGVKGAFYLDTTYLPENSTVIADFIEDFVERLHVPKERVVLYGPSKGGTGSLYCSLTRGWNVVSVDPVIADELYVERFNDAHFTTGGIFPRTKEESFADAVDIAASRTDDAQWQRVIITSAFSPQKPYIENGLSGILQRFTVLDSRNPKIDDHPAVPPSTLWTQLMTINNLLSGFTYPTGESVLP